MVWLGFCIDWTFQVVAGLNKMADEIGVQYAHENPCLGRYAHIIASTVHGGVIVPQGIGARIQDHVKFIIRWV